MKLPSGQYSIVRADKQDIDVLSFDFVNGGDLKVNAHGLPYIKLEGPLVIRRLKEPRKARKRTVANSR